MQKLAIIFKLIRWLYTAEHPNGVRATINKREDGQQWFLVEPARVWLAFYDNDDVIGHSLDGTQSYVRVGGGNQKSMFLKIGSYADKLNGDDNDL